MLKTYLWRPPLLTWGVITLLVMSLALVACGDSATPPAAEEPAEAGETEAQVEAESAEEAEAVTQNTAVAEEAEPTADASSEEEAAEAAPEQEGPALASGPATCEPLEVPVNEVISPVSDEDWARGPATASITVIELGDFQ